MLLLSSLVLPSVFFPLSCLPLLARTVQMRASASERNDRTREREKESVFSWEREMYATRFGVGKGSGEGSCLIHEQRARIAIWNR